MIILTNCIITHTNKTIKSGINSESAIEAEAEDELYYISSQEDGNQEVAELCDYSNREYCDGCPRIDSDKIGYASGGQWCNYWEGYVDPEESPEYNAEHIKVR